MRFLRSMLFIVPLAAAVWVVSARPWMLGAVLSKPPWQAPEFSHETRDDWVNSVPLKLDDLKGQVVVIDFWSRGCWNCRRSLPWLKTLRARYSGDGLRLVGVHTPEFKHESGREGVVAHVAEHTVQRPVMLDNDFSYWNAMGNRYWPTFYLIDKSGRVRQQIVGEVRPGSERAERIEAQIERLLAETV